MLLHICLIWLPAINLEWVFSDGAKYFDLHDPVLLKYYFSFEANTLGMPLLGSALHHVIPFLEYSTVLRVLSISSFPLLGYSLIKLHSLLEADYNCVVLLAVVFLNPLIWTFGGRGTADLFPAALTLFAIALLWEPTSSPMRLAPAIVVYGIAITLKYHAALLLPLVCLEFMSRPGSNIRRTLWRSSSIVCLILIIPASYILLTRQLYGFWLIPPKFRAIHGADPDLASVVTNLVGYAAYLALLLLPYSLGSAWELVNTRRRALVTLAAGFAIFVAGAYGLKLGEEMRFGPLDAYISPRLYSGAFLLFAALFIWLAAKILVHGATQPAHRYTSCMLLGVIIFIGILSFTRPAQRYLLFVLPLSYLLVMTRRRSGKLFTGMTISAYAILILFITLSQVATGDVAQKMIQQIVARRLVADTQPGLLIMGYAGDRFPPDTNRTAPKAYAVIAGHSPKAIVTVESHPAPLVRKVLSLVRYEDAPADTDDSRRVR